jgi:hypothetical protein
MSEAPLDEVEATADLLPLRDRRDNRDNRDSRSARERLALAHAEHAAAADRLRRLHLAIEAARSASIAKFRVIEECEAIVETARREEPRRRAAELLGERLEPAPDVPRAERNLIVAREEDAEQRRLIAVLEQESGRQAFRHAAAQTAFSDAIRDVLEVDEAFLAFELEFLRAKAWVDALADAFRALERFLPRRSARWDRTNPVLPPLLGMTPAAQVTEWLAALREGETGAPFPVFGVFVEPGEPEAEFGEDDEGEGKANGREPCRDIDQAGGDVTGNGSVPTIC